MQEDHGSLQLFLQSTQLSLHDQGENQVGLAFLLGHEDLAVCIKETAANYRGPVAPSCRGWQGAMGY